MANSSSFCGNFAGGSHEFQHQLVFLHPSQLLPHQTLLGMDIFFQALNFTIKSTIFLFEIHNFLLELINLPALLPISQNALG